MKRALLVTLGLFAACINWEAARNAACDNLPAGEACSDAGSGGGSAVQGDAGVCSTTGPCVVPAGQFAAQYRPFALESAGPSTLWVQVGAGRGGWLGKFDLATRSFTGVLDPAQQAQLAGIGAANTATGYSGFVVPLASIAEVNAALRVDPNEPALNRVEALDAGLRNPAFATIFRRVGSGQAAWSLFGVSPSSPRLLLQWVQNVSEPAGQQLAPVTGCDDSLTMDDVAVVPTDGGDQAVVALRVNMNGALSCGQQGAFVRFISPQGTGRVQQLSSLAMPEPLVVGSGGGHTWVFGQFDAGHDLLVRQYDETSGAFPTAGYVMSLSDNAARPPRPMGLEPAGERAWVSVVSDEATTAFWRDGASLIRSVPTDGGTVALVGLTGTTLLVELGPTPRPASTPDQRMPMVAVDGGVYVLWKHATLGPTLSFVSLDGGVTR